MKRKAPPARRRRPAKAFEIFLSEDELASIVDAAARTRAAPGPGRTQGIRLAGSQGFAGIADLVPPLPGLPGGHSSIRDQVFAAPGPLQAPGVSEAIRRSRERGPGGAGHEEE